MAKGTDFVSAIGRRKEAIARVRLSPGKGQITVNGKSVHEYFSGVVAQKIYMKPFELLGVKDRYSATVLLSGGGVSSQLGALVHGLSRALSLADRENFRTTLKRAGLLTRDPRARERRKYGHAQKARAKKQSPRR